MIYLIDIFIHCANFDYCFLFKCILDIAVHSQ